MYMKKEWKICLLLKLPKTDWIVLEYNFVCVFYLFYLNIMIPFSTSCLFFVRRYMCHHHHQQHYHRRRHHRHYQQQHQNQYQQRTQCTDRVKTSLNGTNK